MPKGAKRRAADAAADASAKKGRRASEADVALRLGDELGEHTIVSLANIILPQHPQGHARRELGDVVNSVHSHTFREKKLGRN